MNNSFTRWINKHQLLSFFVLTYALMLGITFVYIYWIPLPNALVWFIGIFSPTISAVLISGLIGGMPEIRRLLAGFTRWKVSLWWYLAAAFLVLGPLFIALLYIALGNHAPGLAPGLTVPVLLGNLVFIIFGPKYLSKKPLAALPFQPKTDPELIDCRRLKIFHQLPEKHIVSDQKRILYE